MKKIFALIISTLCLGFFITSFTSSESEDKKAIKELVETSYVNGAFNDLDPDAMEAAFHPDFAIFSAKGDALDRYEIKDWISSVRKRKSDPTFDPAKNKWEHKFGYIDVTGKAASLKLEYYRNSDLVYTDYISLLKYDTGWKIVAKVYEYHGKEKKTPLFNGKDLTGWEIYGTEKWYVQDGLLICESGPDAGYGYLATTKKYKDFILDVEFKQEANGNSGIFIRSSIEGTKITGWQAEVAPPGEDTGGIYESYGRGWLIKPDPALDKHLKMGEWNKMTVKAVGDQLTTYLNGVQMITLNDEKIGAAMGQVALQIHDGGGIKIRWRNINIQEL